MIDQAVRTRLLGFGGVTALVGTGATARVWPVLLPQRAQPEWPALTFQLISGRTEYDLAGPAGLAEARIQIDCWSACRPGVDAYDEVRRLAEAVRGALSGFRGTVGLVQIQSCFLDGRRSLYEAGAELHRESMDFQLAFSEV